MAFKLDTFDGVPLPTQNATFDFSTPMMGSMLSSTQNGAIDHYGSRRRIKHNQIFEVDARPDAATAALMPAAIRAIKQLAGHTGWLVRTDVDGTNSLRKYCRLLGVGFTPKWSQRGVINVLSMRFESNQPFWYQDTLTTHGILPINSGVDFNLAIAGEEDVLDPIITITATGTMTFVVVQKDFTDAGQPVVNRLVYNDSLFNGDVLVIDCGAYTVKTNGVDSYSAPFFTSNQHTSNYYMRIPVGTQAFNILLGSGSGTHQIQYYQAFQ